MFGMGFWELIVIAIVALLVLGPDKLPEAAKTISKGIRDFRKQTRELQETIESDEEIGGAIRDLKSALRGEEIRPRRPPVRAKPSQVAAVQPALSGESSTGAAADGGDASGDASDPSDPSDPAEGDGDADAADADASGADPDLRETIELRRPVGVARRGELTEDGEAAPAATGKDASEAAPSPPGNVESAAAPDVPDAPPAVATDEPSDEPARPGADDAHG